MKILLNNLNADQIWSKLQNIIPDKYYNHWLSEKEIKELDRRLMIFGNKKLSFEDKVYILNKNGYDILTSFQNFHGNTIRTIKIIKEKK